MSEVFAKMLSRIKQTIQKRKCDGFTVFEILIVVALLVILSRVIIPRLTEATAFDEQRERSLAGTLITLRSQLALYRVEHLDEFPCGVPTAPATPDVMVQRLTHKTNADHSLNGIFGPYATQFPFNPFNGLNDLRYGSDPGKNQAGWCFNPLTGKLWADDSQITSEATAHSEL